MARRRATKKHIEAILLDANWRGRLAELRGLDTGEAVGALFSLILSPDEALRWRAVLGFGEVVPAAAEKSPERGREIMRQMLWRMNEESGGIGWGVPEAMAAAMAGHRRLAEEYHTILISYIQEHEGLCHGNFVDNPRLRRGVVWGVAHLAGAHPDLAEKAAPALRDALAPEVALEGREGTPEETHCFDATSRALACWALGELRDEGARQLLRRLDREATPVVIFRRGSLQEHTVGDLAREALARLAGEGREEGEAG